MKWLICRQKFLLKQFLFLASKKFWKPRSSCFVLNYYYRFILIMKFEGLLLQCIVFAPRPRYFLFHAHTKTRVKCGQYSCNKQGQDPRLGNAPLLKLCNAMQIYFKN